MNQKIRLRYTGLTLYASKGFSILASFAYVLTVTRTLSTSDFGVAQNIGDVVPYLTLLAPALPGWAVRYIARDMKGAARTVLIANLALGIPLTILGVLLAPFFGQIARTSTIYYSLAAFQILELYLISAFESVASGKKPHITGYVQVVHDITRVVLAVALVVYLRMGLIGVLTSVILTYVVDMLVYTMMLRKELLEAPNFSYIRDWTKTSFISFYSMVSSRIASFDMILLVLFVGTVARAYYGAASTAAAFLGYSSVLSTALYPRLLAGGGSQDVEASLKITFMFSIPMGIGVLVLAPSFLTVLSPEYVVATQVLYIMALGSIYMSVTNVLTMIMTGTEKVDAQRRFTIGDLLRSRLFLVPTFTYIYAIIDLPVIYYLLTVVKPPPEMAIIYCAAVSLVANTIVLGLMYRSAKNCLQFRLPVVTIIKCTFSSVIMTALIRILPAPGKLSTVLFTVVLGAAIYLAVLAVLDKDMRILATAVVRELRSKALMVIPKHFRSGK